MKTIVLMATTTAELNRLIEEMRANLDESEQIVDVEVVPIVKSEEKVYNSDLITRETEKFTRYNYIFMATVYIDSEEI